MIREEGKRPGKVKKKLSQARDIGKNKNKARQVNVLILVRPSTNSVNLKRMLRLEL
jgi:hypothetical protein